MPLMKNRPATYDDVEELFSGTRDNVVFRTNETVNVIGARIETLRHTVCQKSGLVRASYRRITAFNTLSEFPKRAGALVNSHPVSGPGNLCRLRISGGFDIWKRIFITIYYQARN